MSKAAITVEAFIANDLTIRTVGSHRVLDMSLPHTPSKKNDQGQWEDSGPTTWYQATFWNEHADSVLQTVQKGSLVTVSGFPEIEVYAKNDGQPGGKIKIQFPTLAVVVRKPKQGQAQPKQQDAWATSTPGGDDVWNTPGNYNDESPF